jgi:hypothetical protein
MFEIMLNQLNSRVADKSRPDEDKCVADECLGALVAFPRLSVRTFPASKSCEADHINCVC